MEASTLWWVLAGTAVGVELITGTFYLLMIAAGLAAGAVVAHMGLSTSVQLVTAGLVGGAATLAWHFKRGVPAAQGPATANSDVNLDVGGTVNVEQWSADGSATVRYRGSTWVALPAAGAVAAGGGAYRIVEVSGSRLFVEKI